MYLTANYYTISENTNFINFNVYFPQHGFSSDPSHLKSKMFEYILQNIGTILGLTGAFYKGQSAPFKSTTAM